MLAVILNNILPTSSNKPPVIGTHLYWIKPDFFTGTNPKEGLWLSMDAFMNTEVMNS